MVDGGSGVDICLLSTLERMEIGTGRIRPNNVCVRAFDGFKRHTIGEIDLVYWSSRVRSNIPGVGHGHLLQLPPGKSVDSCSRGSSLYPAPNTEIWVWKPGDCSSWRGRTINLSGSLCSLSRSQWREWTYSLLSFWCCISWSTWRGQEAPPTFPIKSINYGSKRNDAPKDSS